MAWDNLDLGYKAVVVFHRGNKEVEVDDKSVEVDDMLVEVDDMSVEVDDTLVEGDGRSLEELVGVELGN